MIWNWDESGELRVRLFSDDVFAEEGREDIKEFFKTWLITLVNVLRPRMKKITF